MKFKSTLINLLAIVYFLFVQSAYADFKKATEAYIARNGDSLFMEVTDAVGKKNYDGLMLFLLATNMDAMSSDYDNTTHVYDSTLRSILSKTQWIQLRDLLVMATNDSTLEYQYFLNIESLQFSRELIINKLTANQTQTRSYLKKEYTNQEINEAYKETKSEYFAKGFTSKADDSNPDVIIKRAESGDPYAQSLLGFFSLGYFKFTIPECREIKQYASLCLLSDQKKGFSWLSRAIQTYEQDALLNESYAKLSTGMCNFLWGASGNNKSFLRQAYLWCFLGANLGDPNAIGVLNEFHKAEVLKLVNPQLDKVWNSTKRNEVLRVTNIKELPDMVLEARHQINLNKSPVFSYLFFDSKVTNALEVYPDGHVVIKDMLMTGNRAVLTKISSERLSQFLADIHKTGIDNWPLYAGDFSCPSCNQMLPYLRVTIREGSTRHIFIPNDLANGNFLKIAKMKNIVDKYFPTLAIRVELGKSAKIKNELFNLESKWIEVSKKEI